MKRQSLLLDAATAAQIVLSLAVLSLCAAVTGDRLVNTQSITVVPWCQPIVQVEP